MCIRDRSATPRYVSMGATTDGSTDKPSVMSSAAAACVKAKPPDTTSETFTPCHVVSLSRVVNTPSMVVANEEHPESLVASEGGDGDADSPTP